MDKTKTKLAAFFDNDEEESPFPQKQVDNQKLSQYAQGTVRKSRREKEKEAAEAKKKEEEEHAAKAYAEFLDAFEGEDVGRRKEGANFVKASNDPQSRHMPSLKSSSNTSSRPARAAFDHAQAPPSPPSSSAPKPKGKRAMDAFLEEIKREQAEREAKYSRQSGHGRSVTALAAYEGQSGSRDRGDPQTSNVFVANLPSHVTEQSLGNFFALRAGPVGSVKIMWPRFDATAGPGGDINASRRSKSSGLSGFVSFMKRKDAETALRELDGFDWGGSILRVGWSKAVPVAAKPMYAARRSHSREKDHKARSPSDSRDRRRSRSRSHSRDHKRHRANRSRSRSWSRSRSRSRSHSRDRYRRRHSFSRSRRYDDSRSRSPRRRRSGSPRNRRMNGEEENVTDTFIRAVAAEVKGHGAKFEDNLRERERGNPKYAFLLNRDHRRHAFYRGLLERDDILGPEFDDEGYNSVYSSDSAEDSERERSRKTVLGRLARKRFEAMLRALSGKRGELARCMAFSLEHAEAASEVSEIIVASLLVDGTPVPRKVARLHLICDILHNSAASVPSAWKFRQEFQSRLGIVFDHLANIYQSFPGRITAETFKKQITAVVDIWEDWIVFPPDFTLELRTRLDGTSVTEKDSEQEKVDMEMEGAAPAATSRFKSSSFRPAQEAIDSGTQANSAKSEDGEPMDEGSEGVDGQSVDEMDGEPLNDDVDGIPVDDIDGAPMDDLDGAPMEDVDGEPMDEGWVDGEPIDDDIDGAPVDI